MITVVALARRSPDLSQVEFERRWVLEHAVGTNYVGLLSYQIGIAQAGQPAAPYDGIALMTFTDVKAFGAAGATEEGRARRADADTFCSHLEFFVVEFHDIEIGRAH